MWIQKARCHDDVPDIKADYSNDQLEDIGTRCRDDSPFLELEGTVDPANVEAYVNGFEDFNDYFKESEETSLHQAVQRLYSIIVVQVVLDLVNILFEVRGHDGNSHHFQELEPDRDSVDDQDGSAEVAATVEAHHVLPGGVGKIVIVDPVAGNVYVEMLDEGAAGSNRYGKVWIVGCSRRNRRHRASFDIDNFFGGDGEEGFFAGHDSKALVAGL